MGSEKIESSSPSLEPGILPLNDEPTDLIKNKPRSVIFTKPLYSINFLSDNFFRLYFIVLGARFNFLEIFLIVSY